MLLELAILKNFNSGTYKAGVQLAGSLTTYFDDVPVSRAIPTSALVVGNRVILAIPGDNPKDACVIATWPQGSPGGAEVHGNEYHYPDFATEAAFLAHKARHQYGGADKIQVTYDMTERFFLPSQIAYKMGRFLFEQFNTYDMILSSVVGTGYVSQGFFVPGVSCGATSGGSAVQYQNSAIMYMDGASENFFFVVGYLQGTTDCIAFIGLAANTTQVFTVNEVSKHAGLLFYISGATATVYASNADGVTQTKTDLGLSPNTYRNWIIKSDNGHIYFYNSSTLVATHTTNFPSGLLRWKESIKSAADGNVTLTSRGFTFAY